MHLAGPKSADVSLRKAQAEAHGGAKTGKSSKISDALKALITEDYAEITSDKTEIENLKL